MKLGARQKDGVKTWYYDFTLRGKRYRGWLLPSNKMTRRQAQVGVKKVKVQILTDSPPETKKQEVSLCKQIFDDYEEYLKTFKPHTYCGRMEYLFRHFEFFTRKNRISCSDITDYQQLRLGQGVTGATVNRELNFCHAAFNRAKRKKLISHNPFAGFDKFKEHQRTRFLTEVEINRLVTSASKMEKRSPHLKEIILTALLTGLRLRAILRLHRDKIDFNLGIVAKQGTQTSKRKRAGTVPIPDALVPILKAKIEKTHSGYVF
jgi:integrase